MLIPIQQRYPPEFLETLELMLSHYGYEMCEYVQKSIAAKAKGKTKGEKK